MKKLQYQIVRYLHDRVTAEFVNVGIIVYQPESKFLQGKFINKFSRLAQFFTDVNGTYLLSTLRHFEKEIDISAKRLVELFSNYTSLEEITSSILPKDDSALICSELEFAIDIDPQSTLDDLFDRLVNRYTHVADKEYHDDNYVWRKVYKKYFDKYDLTSKLRPHTITTRHDHIEFDKAWKNGVWNCYQTLSFDLKRNDSIKNKVYKWSGILKELEESDQELNLFFLTVPPRKNGIMHKFIEDTLIRGEKEKLKVQIIEEKEADEFVAKAKNEIEAHQE
ncbi:MAG TPA: DUF3037 domain-containing protein [Bacteroidales bacterium]|nr:DUF3037 domain-containing protein [Bacteroidales bacterium]HRX98456.1 DUF3037 domain-containing protein [Bacteroidales bacterium]